MLQATCVVPHYGSAHLTWIGVAVRQTKGLLVVCRPPSGRAIGQFLPLPSHVTPADWLMLCRAEWGMDPQVNQLQPQTLSGGEGVALLTTSLTLAGPARPDRSGSHVALRWNSFISALTSPPIVPLAAARAGRKLSSGRREAELYCCWVNGGLWLVLSPSL